MTRQAIIVLLLLTCVFTSHAKVITHVQGDLEKDYKKISLLSKAGTTKKASEFIKSILRGLGDSDVTFESCPGPHEEIYDIDDDYSHTEPDLAKKNIDITLILEGVMIEDTHVDQLHVDVYWNGNLFHTEDHKLDEDIEEQEPYELKFSWFVPGFAPSGPYLVDLIVKAAGQELGCERVAFKL
ncbi:unnamed protein product [Moneuplotes crassus]|uniref:Uncharacterized protein n=1 Tax=Euplotes crassus TaxID=5936 RepID=A0A7S3K9Q8_EUPCR|nr:unnamed protein product [Moneuplotes crassus]|mmetsp:Transcript_16940/g.16611  ORF Transcript_16940/g.16611 Transcript_16940/m.16611 type:complete len:183 (+) Transcript_16940:8-556(+)